MALTDNCDIFASINESAVRRVLHHVTHQRPALVNYGSPGVVQRPELLCRPLDAHPVAVARGNTLITALPALPVVLTDTPPLQMEWCFQLSKLGLDVHPGNEIALPPELAPLGAQRIAGQLAVCAGLGCPDDRLVALLPEPRLPEPRASDRRKEREPPRRYPPVTVPTRGLRCFCLETDIVAGADFYGPAGNQHFRALLAGLEIVDLAPQNMEDAIECYVKMAVRFGMLPKLAVPVIRFTTTLFGFTQLAIEPTANSAAVPNNPALEDDSVKLFLDLTTSSITGGGGGGSGGGSGGSAPPSFPGVDRARSRSGPFDLEAALSERAVQELFDVARAGAKLDVSDSVSLGPLTAGYDIKAHLANGSIDLRSDGTIDISELDVDWDVLKFWAGIDLDPICVGGWCIVPTPFGCAVRLPKLCAFTDNPDLGIVLDLSNFLVSEFSVRARPAMRYGVNPGRQSWMNDWDAHDYAVPDEWQLYFDIGSDDIDVDIFDFADIVGNLLENAIDAALDDALGFLPGWARDLVKSILGPVIDVVRDILDLGDDLGEWLTELFGVQFDLINILIGWIVDQFTASPVARLDEPMTLMAAQADRMAVLLPVEFIGLVVDDTEMQLQIDIGD